MGEAHNQRTVAETGKEKSLRHRPANTLMGRSGVSVSHQTGPTEIQNDPRLYSPTHNPQIQAIPGKGRSQGQSSSEVGTGPAGAELVQKSPWKKGPCGPPSGLHGNMRTLLMVL